MGSLQDQKQEGTLIIAKVSQLRNRGIFKAGLDDRSSNDSPKINSYWKQLKAAAPFLQPTHRCLPEPPSSFFLFFET